MADPDRSGADENGADRTGEERRDEARAASGREAPAGAGSVGSASAWTGVERRRTDRRRGIGAGPAVAERRAGPDRRGLMFHVRDFATRFREPLIGVGVAAVSLPLIKAHAPIQEKASPTEERAPASPEAASAATTAAQPNRDMDAEAGARWSDAARTSTVQAAVDRYGISPELATSIYDHAQNEGIDPKLAYGLVKTESSFRHTAVSNVGARGLTQLMPGTASHLEPGTSAGDLFDPQTSLKLGFRYLRQLIDRYDGNSHLALTAYNRGPGTVDRAVKRGRNPDNGYAGAVLGNALRSSDRGADGQSPG